MYVRTYFRPRYDTRAAATAIPINADANSSFPSKSKVKE